MFLIMILMWVGMLRAQVFDVDTVVYNGTLEQHINLVFLSEGYLEGELDDFVSDVDQFTSYFFNTYPFSRYTSYFNVFLIKVPSAESGADHPGTATDVTEPVFPIGSVNTYFDAQFDYFDIHRLLVANDVAALNLVLALNLPQYDQAFLLVNSPAYGGSGGAIPVSSLNSAAAEIMMHELGHSFAHLADEYYAGDVYAGEFDNMTKETNAQLIRWKNWIGDAGVGIYKHCCGSMAEQWYRPHENCKMRYLNRDFCAICAQAIVERIHDLVSPLLGYEPMQGSPILETLPVTFKLNLIHPEALTLKRIWKLNEVIVGIDTDSIIVSRDMFDDGMNRLIVTIEDTTDLLRIDGHADKHIDLVMWEWESLLTATQDVVFDNKKMRIDVSPNPSSEFINVEISGIESGAIEVVLRTVVGNIVRRGDMQINEHYQMHIDGLAPGLYVLIIKWRGRLLVNEKIVIH